MADDKHKRREDAKLVAADQRYEVAYFAKKHNLTMDMARAIIERHGPSRAECDKFAESYNAALDYFSHDETDKGSQ